MNRITSLVADIVQITLLKAILLSSACRSFVLRRSSMKSCAIAPWKLKFAAAASQLAAALQAR